MIAQSDNLDGSSAVIFPHHDCPMREASRRPGDDIPRGSRKSVQNARVVDDYVRNRI